MPVSENYPIRLARREDARQIAILSRDLIEAGLDSLGVTQLMLSIEEFTGVWVDESLLTPENLESAESLASLVFAQLTEV